MSGTGTKLTLAQADKIAEALLQQIDGEAHVVGSVRRRCAEVGDIEIMVHQSAQVNILCGTALFAQEFDPVRGGKEGWRLWQMRHGRDGYVVDLYRFDDANRGSIMLIRTGPAEFSKRFVTSLQPRGYRHDGGYVRGAEFGQVCACPTEAQAFKYAGMKYVEPEDRI